MRLCATFNSATKQCVATFARADGSESAAWFASAEAFRTWLEALEARVEREHRAAVGARMLLQTGSPMNG